MDIRIQTPDPTYIYYPGLCLSNQPAKLDQAITPEPIVIIELITPTTERLILHEKSINYQRIPSLKQIIYIWPNLKIAHVDSRDGESTKWTRKYYTSQDKIPLEQSMGNGELVLGDIFDNMVSNRLSFRFHRNHLIDFLYYIDKKETDLNSFILSIKLEFDTFRGYTEDFSLFFLLHICIITCK